MTWLPPFRRALWRVARSASMLAISSAACASRIPPPQDPGPVGDRAGDFVPGDLDAAIRVDLDAARRFFGPGAVKSVALDVVDPKEDPATAAILSSALDHASTVVVAFRPGLSAAETDHVIVLRGQFEAVDPRAEPRSDWGPPADLGAAFQRYERPAPRRRSAPARIYARASDWLVFVSEAEIDGAERVIEKRARDEHVDPPDRGILSCAFRAEPVGDLLEKKFPAVAEALRGATTVSGSVDADERGLHATLETVFTNDADAAEADGKLERLFAALRSSEHLLGRVAKGAHASVFAATLVIRVELDAKGLATVVDCVTTGAEC